MPGKQKVVLTWQYPYKSYRAVEMVPQLRALATVYYIYNTYKILKQVPSDFFQFSLCKKSILLVWGWYTACLAITALWDLSPAS